VHFKKQTWTNGKSEQKRTKTDKESRDGSDCKCGSRLTRAAACCALCLLFSRSVLHGRAEQACRCVRERDGSLGRRRCRPCFQAGQVSGLTDGSRCQPALPLLSLHPSARGRCPVAIAFCTNPRRSPCRKHLHATHTSNSKTHHASALRPSLACVLKHSRRQTQRADEEREGNRAEGCKKELSTAPRGLQKNCKAPSLRGRTQKSFFCPLFFCFSLLTPPHIPAHD
jgi:hypothetical protein